MEKIWLKHYEKGVPAEINVDEYTSLVQLFEVSCDKFKNSTSYTNMNTSISYGELDKLSLQFAIFLQQLGMAPKARVAIMLPNLLQYPVALFAILRAGYIIVNTNPLYTSEELAHQMNDSEAEAIIVLANFAA